MNSQHRTNKSSHGKEVSRERSRSPLPQRSKYKDEIVDNNDDNNSRKPPENVSLDVKKRLKNIGIQMKLTSTQKTTQNKPKMTVAAAFNQDSDDEPEEMPPEARMRMRNIGRDTPTSSGPNSFGKTKQGFSDSKKVFERNLREAIESSSEQD